MRQNHLYELENYFVRSTRVSRFCIEIEWIQMMWLWWLYFSYQLYPINRVFYKVWRTMYDVKHLFFYNFQTQIHFDFLMEIYYFCRLATVFSDSDVIQILYHFWFAQWIENLGCLPPFSHASAASLGKCQLCITATRGYWIVKLNVIK